MANKLMYIPNYDIQYYPFCILYLVVEMFGHKMQYNLRKSVKPTIKKTLL